MRQTSFDSESGAILLIVIILMLALTITGLAFLSAGVTENSLVRREIHKNQAFYLAEAGVEDARVKLGQDWEGWEAYSPIIDNLKTGAYEATIYNTVNGGTELPAEKRRIKSVGTAEQISKTVQVIVRKPPSGSEIALALGSGGDIEIKSAASQITGPVLAAGEIIDKHDRIDDADEVPWQIDLFANPDTYFYQLFNVTKEEMKQIAQSGPNMHYETAIKNEIVKNITWVDGQEVWSEITSSTWAGEGIFIINGSLKMTGGTFNGIIWVIGSLDIPSGNPIIKGAVFVEADTKIDISGKLDLTWDPSVIDQAVSNVATLPWIEFWEELS